MNPVEMTAVELVAAYASGALSPVEATTAVLDRIEGEDGTLGAFCLVDRDGALAQAAASEERWRGGYPLGPLDGVPVSIKDVLLTEGWPTLRGSTTIGEMQEFYGLQLDVPVDTTLDEVLRRRVDRNRPATNQAMRFGPLVLRIRSINEDGEIERVGMTILPEHEIANYERDVQAEGVVDQLTQATAAQLPAGQPVVEPPKV